MAEFTQPSEIAREVLRRLAQQRIPPTPDNYLRLYHEIAGTQAVEAFPERSLKTMVAGLPRNTPEQSKMVRQLESAVAARQWGGLATAMKDLLAKAGEAHPDWAGVIRELLIQSETPSVGLTVAKKREALDHVLTSAANPEMLLQRLNSLMRSWSQSHAAEGVQLVDGAVEPLPRGIPSTAAAPAPVATGKVLNPELRDLVGQLLENGIATLVADNADLSEEAQALAASIRAVVSAEELTAFHGRLKKFTYRLQFVAEDQAEMRGSLLHLLKLLVENISEIVVDDQWLQGQIAIVADLVSQPPDLRRLDDVERKLKDLIYKQGALKKSLSDAQDRLKSMLATFVDRLADFSASTGDYHDKIEHCAQRISRAGDIAELTDVLDEVMKETRVIQISARNSRDELKEMRQRADEAEKEIFRLQKELAETSDMVRHDALTGALNRRGMDEALEHEVARARRHQAPLCMALLDIDNFKRLNDSLGHEVGDAALVHLVQVVKDTIRPQDTLARYGGEEFVILLPDTSLDDSVSAMTRVQRELTRRFFLHKNEKLLITFSCGVAELGGDEAPAEGMQRADAAMYLAKRGGKNRVLAAC